MNASQFTHSMKVVGFGSMPRGAVVLMLVAIACVLLYVYREEIGNGLFGQVSKMDEER